MNYQIEWRTRLDRWVYQNTRPTCNSFFITVHYFTFKPMFYSSSSESEIKKFYNSLSEKDKRRYAGIEAQKLGWGGISYIIRLLGCSRNTVIQGIEDLKKMEQQIETVNNSRIRNKGGGRKSILSTKIGIDAAFLEVWKFATAGDPMNELIKWTNLTHKEIALGLRAVGFIISLPLVSKLLKKYGYVKRKAQKKQTIGTNKNRNAQF